MRSDLAVTIFLSDLTDYDGGELVLDTPLGMYSVKLPAGDVVVYPATTLHEVRPVTRGVRLVAVTWMYIFPNGRVSNVWDNHAGLGIHGAKDRLRLVAQPPPSDSGPFATGDGPFSGRWCLPS